MFVVRNMLLMRNRIWAEYADISWMCPSRSVFRAQATFKLKYNSFSVTVSSPNYFLPMSLAPASSLHFSFLASIPRNMERLFLDAGDAEWEALLFKPDYCIVLNEAWKWPPKKTSSSYWKPAEERLYFCSVNNNTVHWNEGSNEQLFL